MVKITFIDFKGTETSINVPTGYSVMEGATKNNVAGIAADCGGACSCATCHVYVNPAWVSKLTAPSELEQDMLECTENVTEYSRLSCQIRVDDSLEGLIVRTPESQH